MRPVRQILAVDNCGCIVHEQFDADNTEAEHTLVEYLYRCQEHALVPGTDNDSYNIMIREARLKNNTLKHLQEGNVLPLAYLDETTELDGTITRTLHRRMDYKYYFDGAFPDRKIVYSLEGIDKSNKTVRLSNTTKNSIASIMTEKFGAGKHELLDSMSETTNPKLKAAMDVRAMQGKVYKAVTEKFRAQTVAQTPTFAGFVNRMRELLK